MSTDDDELTETLLASARSMCHAKRARIVAGLSQVDFVRAYGIPLGTLRDWEQHRSEPDTTATAYLTAIINDPTAVAAAYGKTAA